MRSNLTIEEIETLVKEFSNQFLDMALKLRDIEAENASLRTELAHYKKLYRQKQHCESIEVFDLAEDLVLERELKLAK